MRLDTYRWLCLLHERHGAREFGKIGQKLLAIAYRMAGFGRVIERGVQGVDVDAANGGPDRFSTEVKTTTGTTVLFQAKDAAGLAARRADGYQSLLGVLRLSPLSEWHLADAEHLQVGRLALESLRPYRRRDLEDRLRPCFVTALEEHFEEALVHAQSYLDRVLHDMGIAVERE